VDKFQAGGEPRMAAEEPLSIREREIVKLIAEGKSSREIGALLFISSRTVQHHRANIMRKLNLRKTADLVKYAIQKGYVMASVF
jgi:DNA-binding CsgD family transcriptional regulator